MFETIPDGDNEIMEKLKSSAHEQGILATIIIGFGSIVLIILVVSLFALGSGFGMTDADGAKRVLSGSGYSQISITGYRWFTCSQNDYFHTGFEATGPSGQRITGTVCKWMVFKSSTIRVD
jgi:hypothetical protein